MSVKPQAAVVALLIAALPAPAIAAPTPDAAPHAPVATPDPMPPAEPAGETGAQSPPPPAAVQAPAPVEDTVAEAPVETAAPVTVTPDDQAPPEDVAEATPSQTVDRVAQPATDPAQRRSPRRRTETKVTPQPQRRILAAETTFPLRTIRLPTVEGGESSPLVPAAAALLVLALASGSFVMLVGRVGRFGNP